MAKYLVAVMAIDGLTKHSEWDSYRDAIDQADMVNGRILELLKQPLRDVIESVTRDSLPKGDA